MSTRGLRNRISSPRFSYPHIPPSADEFQNKGFTKFVIRNRLILKGAFLLFWGGKGRNGCHKRKAPFETQDEPFGSAQGKQAPALHTQLSTG